MKPSLEQHGRIFNALKKKDGKAARQEMEKHVAERRRVFGPILKEGKPQSRNVRILDTT
jgi:DNA-binding GntR family transcriptional regulator